MKTVTFYQYLVPNLDNPRNISFCFSTKEISLSGLRYMGKRIGVETDENLTKTSPTEVNIGDVVIVNGQDKHIKITT